jgi:hypothetical protein
MKNQNAQLSEIKKIYNFSNKLKDEEFLQNSLDVIKIKFEDISNKLKNNKYNSNKSFNSLFKLLPEEIMENDIFSFLDSRELFFNVRPVCLEWANIMKNLWCNKIKEEMIDQVKTIDLIYEKEVITKTYEFKVEYLFNYRNLLTLYNNNTNVISLIKTQLDESSTNEDFTKLLNHFFDFLSFDEAQEMLINEDLEELKTYLNLPENMEQYTKKFQDMINLENFHEKCENQLTKFRDSFNNNINKFQIECISESARLIYALLQGLVEFEILKHDIRHLNEKKKNLIIKIQNTTNEWPKKKKFFERAYKLLLYSK